MHWGTINNGQITAMNANGGTNSAPPMDTARTWLSTETTPHQNEHGKTPLKFAIFMTDGVNTSGGTTWVAETGTGQWRTEVCWFFWCWWSHENQTYSPGGGWEEGSYHPTGNIETLADCTAMKNAGVKVYTIGFALEAGHYGANSTDYYGNPQTAYIDTSTRNQAYGFLSGCASSPQSFIPAENAEDLEQAFQTIGNDIVTEIIRISG